QFLQASVYHQTWRWPDVLAVTAINPPAGTTDARPAMIAAIDVLAAWANAHLGHTEAALELADKVLKTITATDNPYIIADAWIVKGWCLRVKNDFGNAKTAFEKAVVDGKLRPGAREALEHPDFRLIVTTAETIATRTDKWDPRTETSDEKRAAAEIAEQRRAALGRAQALLDGLIGLKKPKEEMRVWRTEIQIDQIFGDTDTAKENHMVFKGPPGVGKTTVARIAAEILFGLGITDRPDITEVTEEDIVVGFVSQTATRMKEVCEGALGGVLFIDEAPRLVPKTEGHSFGVEAIKTLNKYMEDYRDKLVVIVAGYADEMDRFLDADSGLRSRFNTTLTFASYTPDEIEKIGRHIAKQMKVDVADDAWPLLYEAAAELRGKAREHGTALDAAGNGRFARKVIRACKTERARRHCDRDPLALAALAETNPDELVVSVDDMARAVASAKTGIR
ncbi:MAG: AAA family ATPase, partial [Mycolicibacterium sp.]|nr:AAA family ATPase [Mycolicibacterium sp.]